MHGPSWFCFDPLLNDLQKVVLIYLGRIELTRGEQYCVKTKEKGWIAGTLIKLTKTEATFYRTVVPLLSCDECLAPILFKRGTLIRERSGRNKGGHGHYTVALFTNTGFNNFPE